MQSHMCAEGGGTKENMEGSVQSSSDGELSISTNMSLIDHLVVLQNFSRQLGLSMIILKTYLNSVNASYKAAFYDSILDCIFRRNSTNRDINFFLFVLFFSFKNV